MNSIIISDEVKIENMIYEVRGKQVMLDSDLARLYDVQTKRINKAVRRNPQKFPERFSWLLSYDGWNFLSRKLRPKKNYIETRRGKYKSFLSHRKPFYRHVMKLLFFQKN